MTAPAASLPTVRPVEELLATVSASRLNTFHTCRLKFFFQYVQRLPVQCSCYALMYREATGAREQAIELHHLVKLKTPKLVVTELPPMTRFGRSPSVGASRAPPGTRSAAGRG